MGIRDNGLFKGDLQWYRNSIFYDGSHKDLDPNNVRFATKLKEGKLVYLRCARFHQVSRNSILFVCFNITNVYARNSSLPWHAAVISVDRVCANIRF